MKTAVSLNDELLHEADCAAKELGVSRSRVFSMALESYLRRRRHEKIIEQLNRVYGDQPDPEEKRTLAKMKGKFEQTIQEPW